MLLLQLPNGKFYKSSSHNVASTSYTLPPPSSRHASFPKAMLANSREKTQVSCAHYENNHNISQCSLCLQLSLLDRFHVAKQKYFCINCLKSSHSVSNCLSIFFLRICCTKHYSLLHFEKEQSSVSNPFVYPDAIIRTTENKSNETNLSTSNVTACVAI